MRKSVIKVTLISIYRLFTSVDVLYDLLKERSTEDDPYVNISHRKLPPWKEHVKYVKSKPYRFWYLIHVCGIPVGTCYLTKKNEIGIVLFRAHRGKGYGSQAVEQLIQDHKPLTAIKGKRSGRFIANIHPKNQHSINLFKKLGFAEKQVTYEL